MSTRVAAISKSYDRQARPDIDTEENLGHKIRRKRSTPAHQVVGLHRRVQNVDGFAKIFRATHAPNSPLFMPRQCHLG